jgi:hypothetical protein
LVHQNHRSSKNYGTIIEKIIGDNPTAHWIKLPLFWVRKCFGAAIVFVAIVGALNITMGYSSKNNPAQILIAKLFKMHTNALSRNAKSYLLYYKDVLDILTHPLVEPYAKRDL